MKQEAREPGYSCGLIHADLHFWTVNLTAPFPDSCFSNLLAAGILTVFAKHDRLAFTGSSGESLMQGGYALAASCLHLSRLEKVKYVTLSRNTRPI
jgi:hypothetical protein